jgi:hypothetical protein
MNVPTLSPGNRGYDEVTITITRGPQARSGGQAPSVIMMKVPVPLEVPVPLATV